MCSCELFHRVFIRPKFVRYLQNHSVSWYSTFDNLHREEERRPQRSMPTEEELNEELRVRFDWFSNCREEGYINSLFVCNTFFFMSVIPFVKAREGREKQRYNGDTRLVVGFIVLGDY